MTEPMTQSVYAVRARVGEEDRDYVTVVSPESLGERGLPAQAIVGVMLRPLDADEPLTPDVFSPNPTFVRFLHDVIARHAPHVAGLRAEAARIGEGYVYVMDARTRNPAGEVPREDILGAFKVTAGAPVEGSYRINPQHQLLTARGFFQLGEELHAALMAELARVRDGR